MLHTPRRAHVAHAPHTPRTQGADDVAESVTGGGAAQDQMVGEAEAESVMTTAGGGAGAATGALSPDCTWHVHTRVCGHAITMTAPGGGAGAALGATAVEAVTMGGVAAATTIAGTATSARARAHARARTSAHK